MFTELYFQRFRAPTTKILAPRGSSQHPAPVLEARSFSIGPPRHRSANWLDTETDVLVELYCQDEVINAMRHGERRVEIYQHIAQVLYDRGVSVPMRTSAQIYTRLKNLRYQHQKLKSKPPEEQQAWKYMKMFDQYF